MALIDNLVSYWKMDEASGNALDAHGSNDLTDNNTVESGTGIISGARNFRTGFNEWFSKASNSSLQTGDIDFSISAWVKLTSLSTNATIIQKGDQTTNANMEYCLYMGASNTFRFDVFQSPSTVVTANSGVTGSTATWYHLVAWHDSVNNEIGIVVNDGTPVTTSTSGGVNTNTVNLNIAVWFPTYGFFFTDGLIDEVGFWKRVLTSGDRTALYNAGAGVAYPFSTPAAGIEQIRKPLPSSMQTLLTR